MNWKPTITDLAFRQLLDFLMVTDPRPKEYEKGLEALESICVRESELRGYTGWIDAYHKHMESKMIDPTDV